MNDRELLTIQAATNFVLTAQGRIATLNSPEGGPGPRFYLSGSAAGNAVHVRSELPEALAAELERIAATEAPLAGAGSRPEHLDAYVSLLAAEAPVERCEAALMWVFPERPRPQREAELISSGTARADALLARLDAHGMPPALLGMGFVDTGELWPPWCLALDEGEIAALAFTPCSGTRGAEVGVASVPAVRGQGFAAAAVAGWAGHPAFVGRSLFYSTSVANVSSQRVTERLGLRLLGSKLTIS